MTPTIDWVKRYDKLRETDNMIDSINKLVEEVAASLNRQGCRWVKASERKPEKDGQIVIRNQIEGHYALGYFSLEEEAKESIFDEGDEWLDENNE